MDGVRVGILGCARIAKAALIDAAPAVEGLSVAAVASRDIARAEAFATAHGVPRAYAGYEALLADPEIDAIYNPLPNSLHADWTIAALRAGKAVLCEKPLAANAQEAARMAEAAKASGRPLMEAFHYRHHPLARFVAETVAGGGLGRLLRIDAGFEAPASLVPAGDIRFQADLAGGATMDVGAYCVNALRLAAGEEPRVTGAAATLVAPGVDGALEADLEFAGGAVGHLRCSLVAEGFAAWLRIEGERGWVAIQNPFLPQLGHALEMEVDGVRSARSFDRTPTYVFQARAFRDLVDGGDGCLTTAEDGVANMRAIDAIYTAAGLSPRRSGQARPSEIDQPPSTGIATPVTNEASSLNR